MSKIKSFADACKTLKMKTTAVPGISKVPVRHRKAIEAHYKLVIITEALNEGWKPNWNNTDQYKYHIYFDLENGFSFDDVFSWCAGSTVGSRLCFKNRELAEYAAKKFIKLYKDYFLLEK
jgi:hypothetical protein